MDPRPISYTDPVSRGFESTKRILFAPFNIGKWFALGFSAWLAALLAGGSSFQGNFNTGGGSMGEEESQDFDEFIHSSTSWLQEHLALVVTVAVVTAVIVFAIYVVLLWVNSRGKFMFLDNLVHDRALVKAPWAEFKELANSLFKWRLVFGLIVTVLVLGFVGGGGGAAYAISQAGAEKPAVVLTIIAAVLLLLIVMLVIGYISIMLEDFVIPIMYRDRIKATAAWSRFLALHRGNFWKFVLYFLWSGLLRIGASMGLAMFGMLTCCIGMILMAIPYIGAVVTLPVTTFFRLLGPEFLRQFGDEYNVFPTPPAPPATAVSA